MPSVLRAASSLCPHEHAHEISRPLVGGSPQFSRQNSMDRRTKKPTTKKKPPSKKAMQIKKDAERAKAAADPFATPGSARATLAAHRNKVKEDKSAKNKVYKDATAAYFHGTNAHFRHTTIEGHCVGKVAPAPAVGFSLVATNAQLEQRFGNKEEFVGTPFLPPMLALVLVGGFEGADGKIVFPRTRVATLAMLAKRMIVSPSRCA